MGFYGIVPAVTRILDWLIQHKPTLARPTLAGIIGEAEQRFDIPREINEESIRTALSLDGQLNYNAYEEFLDRALPPTGCGK